MTICEHFIYTTAHIGKKKGYQVIAKSAGINKRIINSLSHYIYPLGINPKTFKMSKSLIKINDNYIAYSIIKNIGKGYDGRDGTIYNHTFVMNIDKFKELKFNSRNFDTHFINKYDIRGKLDKLDVNENDIKSKNLKNFSANFLINVLSNIIHKNKIAIINDLDVNLIQEMLILLPLKMRLVSFSTCVLEPQKQQKYDIIQTPSSIYVQTSKNYIHINQNSKKTHLTHDLAHKLINAYPNNTKIKNIHEEFEIDLELFNMEELENYASHENILLLYKKIYYIYNNSKFHEQPYKKIINHGIKIRYIIKKLLDINHNTHDQKNITILIAICKIILDYLSYIDKNDVDKSVSNMINTEILNIKFILKNYLIANNIIQNNSFIRSEQISLIVNKILKQFLPLW